MPKTLDVYGTAITLPECNEPIENWGTDVPSKQYWKKLPIPKFFEQVEYDKDGNALLDLAQREYANQEVSRCRNGFWFMNNGEETYITGKHYFYLQMWRLEDDVNPDYRDVDRRYFLFLDHWERVPWNLGIVRGKKRREGASSQATANLIYECIFYKNSFCGLVSKTQTDAKNTFTNMVAFGYRQLPVFLKPKQLNNKDSVSELVFAHKSVEVKGAKGSVVDNDTGHRSKIDYRAPAKNAYDSGRLSRLLADELGKFPPDVPASEFIAIVSKTMVKGAKRVGYMECPSTVNEMTKGGGAEFKKLWDAANQFKNDRTPNRLVRYFTPAYDGYLGFIDRHGMSVIDSPNEDQYKYLVDNYVGIGDLTEEDIKGGAKQYLIGKRSQLEGTAMEEEIRMNPFDEKEMFQSSLNGCIFNSFKINQRLDSLSWGDDVIEKGNLVWDNGDDYYKENPSVNGISEMKPTKLIWVANPTGKYEKIKGWLPKEMNNVFVRNGNFTPNGNYAIRIGCDPFKYDKTKDDSRKSDCAAYAYQLEDLLDPNSEYNDCFVMKYVGRASTTDLQYEDVLKMAWFCGCQVLIERNIGESPKKYFQSKKCGGFLMWLPNEVEFGIYTDGNGKTVQMICDYTEAYIEKNIDKVYFKTLLDDRKGWLGFDVSDTQKYDEAMAAGFALIAAKAKKYIKQENYSKSIESILPYRKAN
jgi:hypothetical protein